MYAHRRETSAHEAARAALTELAEDPSAWGLPVFVVGEFLRVVTHPRILEPPSGVATAVGFLEDLFESPSLRLLAPGARFWELLRGLLRGGDVRGNLVFDAQVAAVCLEHGATTILTNDTDFHRFRGLTVRGLP